MEDKKFDEGTTERAQAASESGAGLMGRQGDANSENRTSSEGEEHDPGKSAEFGDPIGDGKNVTKDPNADEDEDAPVNEGVDEDEEEDEEEDSDEDGSSDTL